MFPIKCTVFFSTLTLGKNMIRLIGTIEQAHKSRQTYLKGVQLYRCINTKLSSNFTQGELERTHKQRIDPKHDQTRKILSKRTPVPRNHNRTECQLKKVPIYFYRVIFFTGSNSTSSFCQIKDKKTLNQFNLVCWTV